MKPLIITNHALEQYAARTGRNQFSCAAELINSIRAGQLIPYGETECFGFTVTRRYKGDTYCLWYDPKIDENLLAIIAADGAVKTVLRKMMFSYKNPNTKQRYERSCHTYGYESSPKKPGHSRVH